MPEEMRKKYGAYKVSEFTHGKSGYRFEDEKAKPKIAEPDKTFLQELEDSDIDYKKRYTLGERKESFKKEFKSAKDVFGEFSPLRWRQQLKYIK